MEVHLSIEKQAHLHQSAARTGRSAAQFIEDAVEHVLQSESRFIEAVEVGRAAARRGELVDHDEVVERIEQMFRS